MEKVRLQIKSCASELQPTWSKMSPFPIGVALFGFTVARRGAVDKSVTCIQTATAAICCQPQQSQGCCCRPIREYTFLLSNWLFSGGFSNNYQPPPTTRNQPGNIRISLLGLCDCDLNHLILRWRIKRGGQITVTCLQKLYISLNVKLLF